MAREIEIKNFKYIGTHMYNPTYVSHTFETRNTCRISTGGKLLRAEAGERQCGWFEKLWATLGVSIRNLHLQGVGNKSSSKSTFCSFSSNSAWLCDKVLYNEI